MVLQGKDCIHDGRIKKMTIILHPPTQKRFKNAIDPFIQSAEMWILLVWGADETKCLGVSLFAERWREAWATQFLADDTTYGGDKTKCELVNTHTLLIAYNLRLSSLLTTLLKHDSGVFICTQGWTLVPRQTDSKTLWTTEENDETFILKKTVNTSSSVCPAAPLPPVKTQPLHILPEQPTGQFYLVLCFCMQNNML